MSTDQPNSLDREIESVWIAFDDILAAWHGLGETLRHGDTLQMVYAELIEYASLRVETATSMRLLASSGLVADSLGLGRALLEHVLLLRLMAKGTRYVQVSEPKQRTGAELREALREAKRAVAESQARGELLDVVRVAAYPRGGPSRIMWIREGLTNPDEPDFTVSHHYFQFDQHRPAALRLGADEYDRYLPKGYAEAGGLKAARRQAGERAKFIYDFYLSWSALLVSLRENDLASNPEIRRIEAHYTFLGQFLHPTPDAARRLHDPPNLSDGRPRTGLTQPYHRLAVLLAGLYSLWLLRAVVREIADMLESAPARYIADPGTQELRRYIGSIESRYDYFWFIDNPAPLWDRFDHAVHQVTDDELREAGGYAGIETDSIHMPWDSYDHLKAALGGWSNVRVGSYRSPLDRWSA